MTKTLNRVWAGRVGTAGGLEGGASFRIEGIPYVVGLYDESSHGFAVVFDLGRESG